MQAHSLKHSTQIEYPDTGAGNGFSDDPHAAVSGADYAGPDAFIGTRYAAGRGCHGQAGRHLSE